LRRWDAADSSRRGRGAQPERCRLAALRSGAAPVTHPATTASS
jgi:hypothetical protein